MRTFEEIMEKHKALIEVADSSKMRELSYIISDFTEDMREHHHEEVEVFLEEVENLVCPYLDEHSAYEITSKFVNKDGTRGAHWTKSQVDEVAVKYNIDTKGHLFNCWDLYVAMNMIYSDYYKPTRPFEDYVELTKDWLTDPDWKTPGKTKDYFMMKAKHS